MENANCLQPSGTWKRNWCSDSSSQQSSWALSEKPMSRNGGEGGGEKEPQNPNKNYLWIQLHEFQLYTKDIRITIPHWHLQTDMHHCIIHHSHNIETIYIYLIHRTKKERIFPLCLCPQESSPVSFLLVSVFLALCGGPWSTCSWT